MGNSIQSLFGAERLSGSNRYTTNKIIVKKFYPNTDKLYFAKGDSLVDALTVSPLAKNNGLALVSENSDKSVFYNKETLVQVGGMNRSIVDKVLNSIYNEDSAKPDGLALVSENSDKSVFYNKETLVQVGGMNRSIVDKVLNSIYNEDSAKPDNKPNDENKPGEDSAKPDENKPGNDNTQKPEDNKPSGDTQKPSEKVYDINSAEFQKIVEDSAKPDENKPGNDNTQKPEDNKPSGDTQKPSEKVYDINSAEFQKIVRDEFYRLLDNYRTQKFGNPNIQHHWACEESTMLKSKHMIDNNYFGHAGGPTAPHLISAAENIAGQWVSEDVTEYEGKALANRLFNQWKNSPGHNRILLRELSENAIFNGHHAIDGFAFYAKPSSYNESFGGHLKRTGKQIYMIKATYHSCDSGDLWDTSDTTNPASPGYQPKSN